MTATVSPTDHYRDIAGVRCRLWHGLDGRGYEVWLYVAAVALNKEAPFMPDGAVKSTGVEPPPG